MIECISSADQFLIDNAIEKIREKEGLNPVIFDATSKDFSLSDLQFEIITLDMFNDRKMIIIQNALFLSSKGKLENDQEALFYEILNQIENNILVFTLLNLRFDSKKKTVKKLGELGKINHLDTMSGIDLSNTIKALVHKKNIKISPQLIKQLIEYCPDYQSAYAAIEKLELYGDEITLDVLDHLIIDQSEVVIFDLSNALIEKRIFDALNLVGDLKTKQIDLTSFIFVLASKIRQIYQSMVYSKMGYSQQDIAKYLSISPNYAWVLTNKLNRLLTTKQCLEILRSLSKLDRKLKTFTIDRQLELELWILDFGRRYGKS